MNLLAEAVPDLNALAAGLPQMGVSGILGVAVFMLWKKSEQREIERVEASKLREARIAALEAKTDSHEDQYRDLAEKVTEALTRNTEVMERVLYALPPKHD
jgi:methylmalonyl-CoA mutase N-terminal domain/subunit